MFIAPSAVCTAFSTEPFASSAALTVFLQRVS